MCSNTRSLLKLTAKEIMNSLEQTQEHRMLLHPNTVYIIFFYRIKRGGNSIHTNYAPVSTLKGI